MNPLLTALLATAGLLAAPGLRAVIVRYAVPVGEPPRQDCPTCGQQLISSRRLPPLRALVGRCLACHQRVGPPPLAIESATAVLLAALAARVHPGLVLAAASWLALCAVPLAFIDIYVRRLPDALTATAYAGTTALLALAAATEGQWHDMERAALGGIALVGFYLAIALINPVGLGMGDVKTAASIGTLLAWSGWRSLLAGSFVGFLLAALYGIALMAYRHATRKQQIPLGPFMLVGAFAVILAWPTGGP